MHSLLQVPVKSAVFGRFCFARAYPDRSETYRQRNINSKHTVPLSRILVVHCKKIYTFLVILANLTNQMRVNFKVHTHFQGMRVLV